MKTFTQNELSDKSADKLAADLLIAINNNELVLYYQPQFNVATSTFEGMEALVRWQHPKLGLLLPDEFLKVAEKTNLIILLDEWVLKTACLQFKVWQEKKLSPLRLAVNVSAKQFKQDNFVDFVLGILTETGMLPQCLELELNENMVIQEDDYAVIGMIEKLNETGILIALDDFGTGNSSLEYLKRIPVNRIKIDKSYIQNIHQNNSDAEMVKSLVMLASELNLQLVAEGVETLKQMQMLLFHECKQIQGFYISEPLPAEQMEKFLITSQK
jgi:EAL domain-containing protein (putative c-di-GMP-specific phosphodiesterase class I)